MPARNPFHKTSRSAFKRRRTDGRGLEPIPGSMTYSQPRTKLTKSPVGPPFRMISSINTASRWRKPTSSSPTEA
ncbi:hypothetical protein CUJ84_Chr000207 [Rhizobium leguminosarum]|uniref:Uncharacterized protein n=1 Tax=Rhizobium leguminosarum TaxID=384 RepID=A0A2K9YXB1_RHILE|nr:hypothetical protein CUJ84_Chr000207 [Rhizobium leguminosarum]